MIAEDILVRFSRLLNSRHLVLEDAPVVGNLRNTFFFQSKKPPLKTEVFFEAKLLSSVLFNLHTY